ncbi:MAG: hypothetical protein ACJ749_16385 [Flavisolibacter sp.]
MRRHLILATTFIFFVSISFAQNTDTSFQLLWYKGKKINDTTLITPSGNTVTFSPSGNDVAVVLAVKNDQLSGLKRAISHPSELAEKVKGMYGGQSNADMHDPIVGHVDAAVAGVVQQFQSVLDNHISFGNTIPPVERSSSQKSKPAAVPDNIKEMYNDVLKFVEKLRAQGNFEIPEPPGIYFDYCYPCDVARQTAFSNDSAKFIETFLSEEIANVYKAGELFLHLRYLRSHAPVDSAAIDKMYHEMHQCIYVIGTRIYSKLVAVWDRYKSDAHKICFLVILLVKQQPWYIDMLPISGFPGNAEMAETFNAATKDIWTTARKERDYTILLNVDGILKIFTTIAALGIKVKEDNFVFAIYFESSQFDFFIETEAQTSGTGASMSFAKLHSTNRYSVMPDSQCHLKWIPNAPNRSQYIYELDAIAMRIFNGESLQYAGTTKFKSASPTLKLDFCDEKRDTAHFYGFDPDGIETWTFKGRVLPNMSSVLALYMICFADVQHYRRDPTLSTIAPYTFFFKEHLVNKQKTVFDHTLDGKKLSPQNQFIRYATYRVKIEHVEGN